VPNPQLILSEIDGSTSLAGRCSECHETFRVDALAITDPMMGQRELRDLFDAHVRERHSWRADANQTAARQLRKMMEEFGS
jgi:hypothetical protein